MLSAPVHYTKQRKNARHIYLSEPRPKPKSSCETLCLAGYVFDSGLDVLNFTGVSVKPINIGGRYL